MTGKENTYFERSLTALGVSEEASKAAPMEPVTQGFLDLMSESAKSGKLHKVLPSPPPLNFGSYAALLHEREGIPLFGATPSIFMTLLLQMLCVLVVAEWSYLSWGDRVKAQRSPDKPFWCNEWIDLHSGEYFESVIAYFRSLLDAAGPNVNPPPQATRGARTVCMLERSRCVVFMLTDFHILLLTSGYYAD